MLLPPPIVHSIAASPPTPVTSQSTASPRPANAFLVNGADVSETKNNGAGFIPNIDSVQEFRLITNSFDAEYGKFTGAIMNTITKAGGNRFHGDAFEFYRNDALDAKGYLDPVKASLNRHQFGYAFGGPVWPNRLFFFTDYQGLPTDRRRSLPPASPFPQRHNEPEPSPPVSSDPRPSVVLHSPLFSPSGPGRL